MQSVARQRRRWIAVGGLVLLATFLLSAVYDVIRGHREVEARAMWELASLARVLSEQTRRSVETVDIVLREISDTYSAGKLPQVSSRAMHEYLRQQLGQLTDVHSLVIFSPQGDRAASSTMYPPALPGNFSEQPFFQAVSKGGHTGTFIDSVSRRQLDGSWQVTIARALNSADGKFVGALYGALDVNYFDRFYAAAGLGPATAINLLHADGKLIARFPPRDEARGQQFAEFTKLESSVTQPGAKTARFISPIDGLERFAAVESVQGTPLYVMVTRDVAAELAPWREQAVGTAIRTLLLSAAALALLLIVLRQLTRLQRAGESLEASQHRLRSQAELLELTHDTIMARDRDNRISYWNRGAERMYGYTRDQAVGHDPDELLQTVFPHPVADIRAVLDRDGYWEGELQHQDHDGRVRTVASRWSVHRDPSGAVDAILEINNDVTERERLQAQLRQAQKLEAMGTLAGGIAHDFNNILGAILGFAEMARKDAADETPLARQLDGVLRATQRAKSLVERILAFSRSSMGARVPVHVRSVVNEALDQFQVSSASNVVLRRNLDAGDAAVMGDLTQIHQVVMNLVTNAMHAMPDGGTIEVKLDIDRHTDGFAVTTGPLLAGAYVRLQVSDSGAGMSAAILNRIFDPFFTTRGVGAGTGLGLSLVHGIVTDLGGGIDVASREGEGSRFMVLLPWRGNVIAERPTSESIPPGNGEVVLIVDDEEDLVQVGEEMLAALGYEPVAFNSSEAALAAFRANPARFDAVLSDETMPGMTGSQLAAEIRRLRPDIPFVLMSGYVGPAIAANARAARVNDVLAKPLAARDIARALSAVLR